VPETEGGGYSPFGVICHEFGHTLGLPDLYNTNTGTSVDGKWELMDAGPYDGNGQNPAHMGAWDKVHLGWIHPNEATSKGSFSLSPVESSASALKMPISNGVSQGGVPVEYFLAEYRSQTGGAYDHAIPGDGLLIWHVDDSITAARGVAGSNTVNTGSPHDGVLILPADGVAVSSNQGDAGNPFGNQKTFSAPQSNNFNGDATGIILSNIAGIGSGTASFQVADFSVPGSQAILKLINYPNPAGNGYPHPSGQGHTTIQFQLSKPANDYSINLYTLSGDLVRKVGADQIRFLLDTRSTNDKFVYEFDWDLKNGDGAMVAPGVYLYLLRADGQTQTGKAVVIR